MATMEGCTAKEPELSVAITRLNELADQASSRAKNLVGRLREMPDDDAKEPCETDVGILPRAEALISKAELLVSDLDRLGKML